MCLNQRELADPLTLGRYVLQIKLMHTRDRAADLDFSEVLTEETESELKDAAAISMGTDISESDIANILALCEQACAVRWRSMFSSAVSFRHSNGLSTSARATPSDMLVAPRLGRRCLLACYVVLLACYL